MNPTQTLPENYVLAWAVDMKKQPGLNIALQFAGAGWFFVAGWLVWLALGLLRPAYAPDLLVFINIPMLVAIIITIFAVTILHELVHGLFFWIFSKSAPRFGIGPGYAYAAAPDWYFPKGQYLVIGLSPLVVLTVAGLGLIAVVPAGWIGLLALAVIFNAGGAIGDMYVCARIALEAPEIWIKDTGDGFEIYRRGPG
jgi:hypothetical protein